MKTGVIHAVGQLFTEGVRYTIYHASFMQDMSVSVSGVILIIDGRGDFCEVEIYGEYTIDTTLQTDFHAFDLCRIT